MDRRVAHRRAACPRTRFRRAEVEAIDLGARTVTLRTGPAAEPQAIAYDHLVLALGAVPNYRGIPGLEEHAFTLKTLEDAERLRNHVIGRLERADTEPDPDERRREVTFVVVGGGFAGVEMAGGVPFEDLLLRHPVCQLAEDGGRPPLDLLDGLAREQGILGEGSGCRRRQHLLTSQHGAVGGRCSNAINRHPKSAIPNV